MALMSPMINMKKLLGEQQVALTDKMTLTSADLSSDLIAEIGEAKQLVTATSNETRALVSTENDETQAVLSNMSTGEDLNANTANVNAHTSSKIGEVSEHITTENNRVLTALSSNSVIEKIQRGNVSLNGGMGTNVPILAVDISKSVLNVSCESALGVGYNGAKPSAMAGAYIASSTSISVRMGQLGSAGTWSSGRLFWELIEYV